MDEGSISSRRISSDGPSSNSIATKVGLISILQLIFQITSKLHDPPHVELQRPPRGMELAHKSTYSLKVHCVLNIRQANRSRSKRRHGNNSRKAALLSHQE